MQVLVIQYEPPVLTLNVFTKLFRRPIQLLRPGNVSKAKLLNCVKIKEKIFFLQNKDPSRIGYIRIYI